MPDVGIPGATEPEVEQMHPEPTTVADARAGNKEAVAFLEEEECYAAAGEFVAVIHAEFNQLLIGDEDEGFGSGRNEFRHLSVGQGCFMF